MVLSEDEILKEERHISMTVHLDNPARNGSGLAPEIRRRYASSSSIVPLERHLINTLLRIYYRSLFLPLLSLCIFAR